MTTKEILHEIEATQWLLNMNTYTFWGFWAELLKKPCRVNKK